MQPWKALDQRTHIVCGIGFCAIWVTDHGEMTPDYFGLGIAPQHRFQRCHEPVFDFIVNLEHDARVLTQLKKRLPRRSIERNRYVTKGLSRRHLLGRRIVAELVLAHQEISSGFQVLPYAGQEPKWVRPPSPELTAVGCRDEVLRVLAVQIHSRLAVCGSCGG